MACVVQDLLQGPGPRYCFVPRAKHQSGNTGNIWEILESNIELEHMQV